MSESKDIHIEPTGQNVSNDPLELALFVGKALDPKDNASTFLRAFCTAFSGNGGGIWLRKTDQVKEESDLLRLAHCGTLFENVDPVGPVLAAAFQYAQKAENQNSPSLANVFRLKDQDGHYLVYLSKGRWMMIVRFEAVQRVNEQLFGSPLDRVLDHFWNSMELVLGAVDPNAGTALSTSETDQEDAMTTDQLRSILDRMSHGTLFEDSQRKVSAINDKLLEFFGMTREDMQVDERPIEEVIRLFLTHFKDPDPVVKWADQVRVEGVTEASEPMELKDGRFVQLSLHPFVTDGMIEGMLWRFTERTASNQAVNGFGENFFKTLIDTAADYIFACDQEGKITYANEALEQLLGLPQEEILDQHYESFISEEFREMVKSYHEQQVEKKRNHAYFEYPVISGMGEEVWLGQHVNLLRNEGAVSGYTAVARDIAAWKLIEDALTSAEQRFIELFHQTGDAILIAALDGEVKDVNRSGLDLLGYEKRDIWNLELEMLIQPESYQHLLTAIEEAQHSRALDMEVELKRKTGDSFTANVSGTLMHIDGEDIMQLKVYSHQKSTQVETHQKEVNSFYAQLLDAIPSRPIVYDRKCNYLYVGARTFASKDLREWIIGKSDVELCQVLGIHEDLGRKRKELVKETLETGEAHTYEESYERADGHLVYEVRYLSPIKDLEGNVVQVLGSSLDVTEARVAARKVRENQVLERAMRMEAMESIILIDPEGRLIDCNPSAEQIFGWDRADVVGKRVSELMAAEDGRTHSPENETTS